MKPNSGPLRAARSRDSAGLSGWALLTFAALLVLPVLALRELGREGQGPLLVGAGLAVCILTFLLYRADKRRAEEGKRRVPETTLHLAEFAGGWPGAYLAQRTYRHKTSKISYQIFFWMIVAVHQFLAAEYLAGGNILKTAIRLIKTPRF
jgi:uncharacterized membrane protein YsdA (DUF1294 family)